MTKTLFDIFMAEARRLPKLSHEEQVALNAVKTTDPAARHRLILSVLPWAIKIASKYNHHESLEERVSYAMPGLCRAVDGWIPERGKLTTITAKCVFNELRTAIRKQCHPVVPPQSGSLPKTLEGRQQAANARAAVEVTPMLIDDYYAYEPLPPCDPCDTIRQYRAARDALPSVLREVILGCEQGDTYQTIGDRVGLSRQRIEQLRRKAIEQLREIMVE